MIGDVVKPMPSDRGWFVYHLFLLELGTVYCWLCLVNCWVENDMTKFGGAFGAPFLKSRLRNELQVACRKTQQLFLGGASPIFNRHAPNYIQLYTSARNIGYNIYIYTQYIYIYTLYIHIYTVHIYIYIGHNLYTHSVYIYIHIIVETLAHFWNKTSMVLPTPQRLSPLPGVLAGQWRLCQGLPHGGPGNNEEALRGVGFSLWYVYI